MKILKLSLIAIVLTFAFACSEDESGPTRVINDNPPTITLSLNGVELDNFTTGSTIHFDNNTVVDPNNQYIVTVSSTAQNALDNISLTFSSTRTDLNTALLFVPQPMTLDGDNIFFSNLLNNVDPDGQHFLQFSINDFITTLIAALPGAQLITGTSIDLSGVVDLTTTITANDGNGNDNGTIIFQYDFTR